jgi:hypothetical protein
MDKWYVIGKENPEKDDQKFGILSKLWFITDLFGCNHVSGIKGRMFLTARCS